MPILEARQVDKTFAAGERAVRVLDQVSLQVDAGEFLVIEGSSGSGKSTLLSLLSGLDKPTAGRVLIENRDITDLKEDALAPLRNATIGFVFQSFHLIPSLTALENVMFPAELRHDPQAGAKSLRLLERVGLDPRQDNFPHQLSGGEKQRVALCRALVNAPKIIFADEPTGNLDSANGHAILHLLMELRREHGSTLVLVTHNLDIARTADRVVLLQDGRIRRETPGPSRHVH
jgi:putative ABC transport system ATP-binding protein